MSEKKYAIFGAGRIGRRALDMYGDKIVCFVDNNPEKVGSSINGVPVKSLREFLAECDDYVVVIASRYEKEMETQLLDVGFSKSNFFVFPRKYYGRTNALIYNPYENDNGTCSTEEEWNKLIQQDMVRDKINEEVERLYHKEIMFNHVEIETVNRCNGGCDFCPVSKGNDSREYKEMTEELFKKIIDQLADISYSGRLALFSNNEPFLDKHIIERHIYARKKLPHARMHLFTNGTLLTLDKILEIIQHLDELVIDNYHPELKLIAPCQELVKYSKAMPDIAKKVTIVLRNPHEILTSRGGEAPNRKKIESYANDRCLLPFKQIIIRPDGKVSLCCNDPLGKMTLGDLNEQTIMDVWQGLAFNRVRDAIFTGRDALSHCRYCDSFIWD